MDVGIGLPNAVRGVDRRGIVEWAQRAEAAGFSSLGTIDRIAYANYESLISLAAAAAVTERIRLVTHILLAPLSTRPRAIPCPGAGWCSGSRSADAQTTMSSRASTSTPADGRSTDSSASYASSGPATR